MKYKIILILLLGGTASFAQPAYKLPVVNKKPFPVFIDEEFRNHFANRLDTTGLHGFSWAKFKVDASGNVQQLEISPGTHPVLTAFLKEILIKTNGLWHSGADSHWLILPFRYTLQKNGKSAQAAIDPFQLEEFLLEENGLNKETSYTFLPVQEFVSPYDDYPIQKMKLQPEK